jgi:hypothetical protein
MYSDKDPRFRYQLGTPPEPHPSPIQDPVDPPENPDPPSGSQIRKIQLSILHDYREGLIAREPASTNTLGRE